MCTLLQPRTNTPSSSGEALALSQWRFSHGNRMQRSMLLPPLGDRYICHRWNKVQGVPKARSNDSDPETMAAWLHSFSCSHISVPVCRRWSCLKLKTREHTKTDAHATVASKYECGALTCTANSPTAFQSPCVAVAPKHQHWPQERSCTQTPGQVTAHQWPAGHCPTCSRAYVHTCVSIAYGHTCLHACVHTCVHTRVSVAYGHTCVNTCVHTRLHTGVSVAYDHTPSLPAAVTTAAIAAPPMPETWDVVTSCLLLGIILLHSRLVLPTLNAWHLTHPVPHTLTVPRSLNATHTRTRTPATGCCSGRTGSPRRRPPSCWSSSWRAVLASRARSPTASWQGSPPSPCCQLCLAMWTQQSR